ncbi:helix-turn-helix transcriptional regulator [Anaerolineae bacterium CFX7]|nr:helix-turn-helix transcriptional regulator [Anaerolineae bacterium CFX7]
MDELLTERYADQLDGVLSCYDRIVITGSLQPFCYAHGMTRYLYQHGIRIFDYAHFAEPLRERLRANAEALAKANGLQIEFVRKKNLRKEARIQQLLKARGEHPGLVHIFGAMESCATYRPWHDKPTGKTYLKPDTSKCMTYYFYFLDPQLGLCYLRVPTWCPFRLQFYFNGHNWLAHQLQQRGIAYKMLDNAFVQIADYTLANQLAKEFDVEMLHPRLDEFARQYYPVITDLQLNYYWSILQAEYATDLVFKHRDALQAFYPHLLETLTHAVKPADIATFLGRRTDCFGYETSNYQGELGNRFNQRWLGTRLKHQMGPVCIKMYDKFGFILRLETTVNQVSFFRQYRTVQHRDGSTTMRWAPLKKTIHSLSALRENLDAANQRYLQFILAIATPHVGVAKLHQLAETKTENQHRHKGFNLFAEEGTCLFRTLLQGEFCISGFTNPQLRQHLPNKSASHMTRLLKRLRVHGIIKKVGKRYKYYLTDFGRETVALALKLRELVIIPELAFASLAQA